MNHFLHKIVFIGAGNLATQLALALKAAGCCISQVYSRKTENAARLALRLETSYTTDIQQIATDADLYILAVSDDAIRTILSQLKINEKLIVHTAGSVNISVFEGFAQNYGVFYPLQTFTRGIELDFKQIPICIEANSPANEQFLTEIAKTISAHIYMVNSAQRRYLHLGAVIVNNFANHLFAQAETLLAQHQLPFDILKPLIQETVRKIMHNSPATVQTGPAARRDTAVIDKHLEMLNETAGLHQIYEVLSQNIIDFQATRSSTF